MATHLTEREIERYHRRDLSPSEIMTVCKHVTLCGDCRARMGSAAAVEGLYTILGPALHNEVLAEPSHLSPDCLAAYTSGSLNQVDSEVVEAHLDFCARCRAEIQELKMIKSALDSERVRRPSAINWLTNSSVIARAAAALVIVFLTVMIIITHNETRNLRSELNAVRQTGDELSRLKGELSETRTQLEELRLATALTSHAELSVALQDASGTIGLDKQGNVTGLGLIGEPYNMLVVKALTTGRPATPTWLRELTVRDKSLMGESGLAPFRPLEPSGVVVASDRPVFRWSPLAGATSYRVVVSDSSFGQVATSEELQTTEWTPPKALPRGVTYRWSIRAVKDGKETVAPAPPLPQARFRVLDKARLAEVNRARRDHGNSHLLMGAVYANAGLVEDAEREFEALVRANPRAAIPEKLLANIKAGRK